VGIPWAIILGFVRLSTTRGVFAIPATPVAALDRVDSWLEQPGVFILNADSPTSRRIALHAASVPGGELVRLGTLPATPYEGEWPITQMSNLECVDALMTYPNVDINSVDHFGKTILDYSIEWE
jgi:hypothetical protein